MTPLPTSPHRALRPAPRAPRTSHPALRTPHSPLPTLLLLLALLLSSPAAAQKKAVRLSGNPILPEFHADPEILYSEQTNRFYIYSTTDGYPGWGGYYFTCFSSPNLVDWKHEGIILDTGTSQVPWATGNAWAPAIIEKTVGGRHKYYFYYSAHDPLTNRKAIGVATGESPTGPFYDYGKPIINDRPNGVRGGQQIDVDVFEDPITGKNYLYWGNGYMAVAELNRDMVSIDTTTIRVITPESGTLDDYQYREAPYVFFRKGLYYFLWSVDDTGAANYHVAYGTAASPTGPITVATHPIVIQQDAKEEIFGTAHNSVICVPGTDDWYIVYHRINAAYLDRAQGPGFHRQVCIDHLQFDKDGAILPVTPTHSGVSPVKPKVPKKK